MRKTKVFADVYETINGAVTVANDFLSACEKDGCEIVSVDIQRETSACFPYMVVIVYKE